MPIYYFVAKPLWQKTFGVVLMILWIPKFSYTYVLIYLSIPLIQFLNDCQNSGGSVVNICIGICFMITQIPLALPSLYRLDIANARLPLTYPTLIINLTLVVLTVFVGVDTLFHISMRQNNRSQKEHTYE